jgi:hypothetical protein
LPPPPPPDPIVDQAATPPPVPFRVMLVGDSTANSLGWGLRGTREPGLLVELLGKDGCTMLADTCGGADWAREAKDLQPDAILVFLGGAFLHGVSVHGDWQKACHREWDAKFQKNLAARLGELTSATGQVWVVTVPYPLGPWDSAPFRREVDCINASIRKAAGSAGSVRVLDLAERLCPKGGTCEEQFEGATIRPDGAHYSVDGALGLSHWILEQLQSTPDDEGVASRLNPR